MRNKYLLITLFAVFWLAGCSNGEKTPTPPPVDDDPKTLLIYGNINYPYYKANVAAAGKAVAAGALIDGQRVIVCAEVPGSQGKILQNVIFELKRDKKAKEGFIRDTLRVYEGEDVKSTLDPDDMKYLLEEMRSLAPANHYGLALGAHASGWIPKTSTLSNSRLFSAPAAESDIYKLWEPVGENPLTRYIGHTNGYGFVYRVDIVDFARVLEEMDWDFVLFDACFMGSVEAVYEMRKIAPYLIVSPAEVLIEGFPYDRIVKTLFDDWTNLESVCAAYMESYTNSSATISLVKTGELENLAATVRDIRLNGPNTVDPKASVIQYFEGLTNHVFYDLDDYIRHWSRSNYLYRLFYDQLLRTLPYTGHTPTFFSGYGSEGSIRIHYYSGLTAFIPYAGKEELIPFYHGTSWYKAVYE